MNAVPEARTRAIGERAACVVEGGRKGHGELHTHAYFNLWSPSPSKHLGREREMWFPRFPEAEGGLSSPLQSGQRTRKPGEIWAESVAAHSHLSPAQVPLVTTPWPRGHSVFQASLRTALPPPRSTPGLPRGPGPVAALAEAWTSPLLPSPTETRVEFFQRLSIGKGKGKQSQK